MYFKILCFFLIGFVTIQKQTEAFLVNPESENVDQDTMVTDLTGNYHDGFVCKDYVCSRCVHLEINTLKLKTNACLNLTYSDINQNIQVSFGLNGNVCYNTTISSASEKCFETAYLNSTEFCLKFVDIKSNSTSFSGSVELLVKQHDNELAQIKFGSFHFGNVKKEYLQDSVDIHNNIIDLSNGYYYECKCTDFVCSCCAHVQANRLNTSVCLNLGFSDINENIQVSFDLAGKEYYNSSIPTAFLHNLCFEITPLYSVKLCLNVYDLVGKSSSLSGSVELIVKLHDNEFARIKLGSFHFGKDKQIETIKNTSQETDSKMEIDLPQIMLGLQLEEFKNNLYKTLLSPKMNKNRPLKDLLAMHQAQFKIFSKENNDSA